MAALTNKKIVLFAVEIIGTTIIFTSLVWLFEVIFDGETKFDWSLLLQGFVFAIIYVPISRMTRLEKREKK